MSDRKNNPKKFFSFIKSKKQDNIGITSLKENGAMFTSDKDIARILNDQFISVFSKDDGITPEIKGPKCPQIGNITITQNGVTKLLEDLDQSKASGPDGISTRILKECAQSVCKPLTIII